MASFLYVARETASGREIRSSVDAASESAAISALLNRNMLVLSIQEKVGKQGKTSGGRVALSELVMFTRQLATMIDAGLAMVQSLQALADQSLEGQSAALIVMDVNNGDVIAMSSTPGFDPNLFNVGLNGQQWRDLTTDDHKPLLNKFMGGIYPPGSTFKTAVALAAIDAGIATPDYHVNCNGVFNFGGHAFHCWQLRRLLL